MQLRRKKQLAKSLQYSCGVISGMLVSYVHIKESNYLLGVVHLMLWGGAFYYGVKIRSLVRYMSGSQGEIITPSWTSGIIFCLLISGILYLSVPAPKPWLNVVMGINIAYFGAKYNCFVYRCCDVHFSNRKKRFFENYRLAEIEMAFTLVLIIILTVVMIFLQRPSQLLIFGAFLCHIVLRYYSSLLRFPQPSLFTPLKNYTIFAPVIIFFIMIW